MIPSISHHDVLAAIDRIRREGVPPRREATRYALIHEGRHYPPKYVVSLAVENARGIPLKPEEFSGGAETNSFLEKLRFEIRRRNSSASESTSSDDTTIARVILRGKPTNAAQGERLLLRVLEEKWLAGLRVKFLTKLRLKPTSEPRTDGPGACSVGEALRQSQLR